MKAMQSFLIIDDSYNKLCKIIFKVLSCNLLWVIHLNNISVDMLATDRSILDHYLEKKYYLQDPNTNINLKPPNKKSSWKITLGTDCDGFNKNGFLYDLYKIFQIEEFISIEKVIGTECYCFRFFTRNNRFVFMNKLLNNMQIVKHFIMNMIEQFKRDLVKQAKISVTRLM